MLLPHGYEGQGAEHSSARMERYLQLCARDNMYVADCTTPANIYHLLRRQMKANFRKPLIVFTPKSLLRHPKAVSGVEEFSSGGFQEVIDDASVEINKVRSVVFCTGKFYYDLLAFKDENKRDDVALVRVEQLFPVPEQKMTAIIKKYKKADDWVWAQEEPRNMGAWSHMFTHYSEAQKFRVASRRFYASPSAGSAVRSKLRQQQIIDYVFDKTKDNMTRRVVKSEYKKE
jgi:2-oxoglutarate dehydrogenase E1 component